MRTRNVAVATVSQAAYEYLPDGRVWFRPFVFVAWNMPATRTRHYLLATLEPKTPDTRDHPRSWAGPLVLPRVQLPAPEPIDRP